MKFNTKIKLQELLQKEIDEKLNIQKTLEMEIEELDKMRDDLIKEKEN